MDTCYVPGTALGIGNKMLNKAWNQIQNNLKPSGIYIDKWIGQ